MLRAQTFYPGSKKNPELVCDVCGTWFLMSPAEVADHADTPCDECGDGLDDLEHVAEAASYIRGDSPLTAWSDADGSQDDPDALERFMTRMAEPLA